jgi:hypothetical protein
MPVEYEVVVGADKIVGRLCVPDGEQTFPQDVAINDELRLRLDTIDVLRSWLNRWPALTRVAGYEHLTVGKTSSVLGRHLYATVFGGEVGRGMLVAREEALKARTTLRLLLIFKETEWDLAQLPWELLYTENEFLTNERLVLSRRLPVTRRTLEPPEPPLMVHFLVTVPDTRDYHTQRLELLAALDQPMEYTSSIRHKVLRDWNEANAARMLRSPPYPQVVHVIGVCRPLRDQEPGKMEIFLDDGEGEGPRWRNAQILLNVFPENELLPDA